VKFLLLYLGTVKIFGRKCEKRHVTDFELLHPVKNPFRCTGTEPMPASNIHPMSLGLPPIAVLNDYHMIWDTRETFA
jgi:hypothetical protein